jgi:asparagine synthetase B (glutamine-hydrolysing)
MRERNYPKAAVEFFLTLDLTSPFLWRYPRIKLGMRKKTIGEVITVKPPPDRPLEYPTNNLANRLRYDLLAGSIILLLRYEDANSMAFSIESRVAFLLHPMVEYAFELPMTAKIKNGWTKYILREAMKNVIPEKIRVRRNKLGFPAPFKEWAKQLIKERLYLCISIAKEDK